jgi:hypothetical protein
VLSTEEDGFGALGFGTSFTAGTGLGEEESKKLAFTFDSRPEKKDNCAYSNNYNHP